MESIKKKMQAMKQEKENATDLADQAEEKTKLAQQKLSKVNQIFALKDVFELISKLIHTPKISRPKKKMPS